MRILLPDLLRRVAVLTAISVLGIGLLAPLTARSGLVEPVETIHLLDAAATEPPAIERSVLSSRELAFGSALTDPPTLLPPEALQKSTAPPSPPAAVHPSPEIRSAATPTPRPVVRRGPAAPVVIGTVDGSVWDRLAQCESGGNWSINTGNGYYGGLQFNYATWHQYGGGVYAEYPHQATREQQIAVAERLHAARGFQPWPACRIKLGLP